MAVISMKQFLEAGVHFGHQTKRWHPNMAPYIYGTKNGVHVIDLRQTLAKLKEAYEYVKASAEEGRVPLFVGTKIQIQRIVREEAERCGSPYINFRWLGGLLTNFGTVKESIARMKNFEEIAGDDRSYEGVIKKEALMMERKRLKLERSLGGVRNMKSVPPMLFITDCHKEQLALKEARKLGISVVGIVDTNCDPTGIDYVIPGNDDSPRAVALYANVIATAVMEGLASRKQRRIETITEEKSVGKKAKPAAKVMASKEENIPKKIKGKKTKAVPGPKSAEIKVSTKKAKTIIKAKKTVTEIVSDVKVEVEKPSIEKSKGKKNEAASVTNSEVEKKPVTKTVSKEKKPVEKVEIASGKKSTSTKATKAKKPETKT